MKVNSTYRTSDYVEWNTAMNLVHRLYRDGDYRMSLLFGCGCFFGLRISDILTLTWDMLLYSDKFVLNETKTGKRREVKINRDFQRHIRKCHVALKVEDDTEHCFVSRKHTVYTTQRINKLFKEIKRRYNLKVDHFSTHSMRKTFGRRVVEASGENAEMAIIRLSELFNHANTKITRIYLGIRQEELLSTYDMLDF